MTKGGEELVPQSGEDRNSTTDMPLMDFESINLSSNHVMPKDHEFSNMDVNNTKEKVVPYINSVKVSFATLNEINNVILGSVIEEQA